MFVKEEMTQFLETHMENFESKNRELILYHYGFLDGICHTLDETGEKYSSPETQNKRARPQQILNDEFKPRVRNAHLISLDECQKILSSNDFWVSTKYVSVLHKNNLVSNIEDSNLVGIMTLIEQLDLSHEYSIYSSELKKLGSKTVRSHEVFFLIKNSLISDLDNGIKIVNGEGGLTSFSKVGMLLGEKFAYKEYIFELVKTSTKYICIPDKDDNEFYLYVKRKNNTFQKSFAKIYGVLRKMGISAVNIIELSEALHNSLGRRGSDNGEGGNDLVEKNGKFPRPPIHVIQRFIEEYNETTVIDGMVSFHGEIQNKFDDFDNYIVEFFSDKGEVEHSEIIEFLLDKKRYSPNGISNRFIYSPLVRVNREMGWGQYTYSLVGSPKTIKEHKDEEGKTYSYEELKKVLEEKHQIGVIGENFVNAYLVQKKKGNLIRDFVWVSQIKANSDHDFSITELDGSITYVDVKATKNNLGDRIYISKNELEKISKEGSHYYIYRIFNMKDDRAVLRIISNAHELATEIFQAFKSNERLQEVFPESVSLPATLLDLGDEISLSK